MLSRDDMRELLETWALKMRRNSEKSPLEQFEPEDVVSLCLAQLSGEYGMEQANQAIEDFGLEELGFRKKQVK